MQFLDHTVGLAALKLRRHEGRLVLERRYDFAVSVSGSDRQPGSVWLLHGRLTGVRATWLKPPDAHVPDSQNTVTYLLKGTSQNRIR